MPPALLKPDADDAETDIINQNITENSQKFNPYQLVDVTPPKRKHDTAPGHPKKGLLDTFLQQCYRQSQPEKCIFCCVGEGCSMTFTNRNLPCTLKHACACNKLPKDLHLKAKEVTAKSALSWKVAEWHKRLDFAILLLICAAGLPMYLVSRPEWRRVFMIVDSTYTPATRERLEMEQIVNKAKNVAVKQREFLKMQENLMISCDGGTSKGREAFWTIHVSTSPRRKVYLMECHEATLESHTGVWIKNFVLEARVIDSIGCAKFCAVVCDSTGNTRLSWRLLVLEVPTALNLADIVHHISNTLKDIIKLKYFENSIKVVHGIITKFHMSHLGMAELKVACKVLCTGPGLEAIVKNTVRYHYSLSKISPAVNSHYQEACGKW
ncbi:hypothetical protein L208DRAFT_1553448 [Tricholoma matsutake]|nr:hypothetical protein L208DRAFT_1553448 [Tricholoma matsutake 945]